MKRVAPPASPNPFAELSDAWISTWVQPWSAWQTWSKLWGDNWQRWLEAAASVPAPWLPALAEERRDQPVAIDFFLPWLPRTDHEPGVPVVHDPVSLMLRAAAPVYSLLGKQGGLFPDAASLLAEPGPGGGAEVPAATPKAKAPAAQQTAVKPSVAKTPAKARPGGEGRDVVVAPVSESAPVAKAPVKRSRRAAAAPAGGAGSAEAVSAAKRTRSRKPPAGSPKTS